jgi:F0F1-type ATP synthase assembly protein I
VLRACQMLYAALASFVGTSLTLAMDALLGFRMGALPTMLAVFGVLFLLAASFALWREVSLSVRSFDDELDHELARRRG